MTTLCEACNGFTGRVYAFALAAWVKRGFELLERRNLAPTIEFSTLLYPLPLLKQILTMFLGLHGRELGGPVKSHLRNFVLNREMKYLDPTLRVWTYFVAPGPLRNTPPVISGDVFTGKFTFGSEFSFPPFGYMLTIDSVPQDNRLTEISYFSRYSYHDLKSISLRLNTLPTHTPFLGDTRSFKDMEGTSKDHMVMLDFNGSLNETTDCQKLSRQAIKPGKS